MTINDMYTNWLSAQNAETEWFEANRSKLNLRRCMLHEIDQKLVDAHPQLYPILLGGKAGERECSFMTQFTVPCDPTDLCVDHIADLQHAERSIMKRLSQLTYEAQARVEGYSEWLETS